MMDKVFISWVAAFLAGLFLFLCGIIYIVAKRGRKEENFAKSTLFEFFACWILFIPQVYYNELPDNIFGMKISETLITSLIRTFVVYFGDGYERIEIEGHNKLTFCYTMLMAFVNLAILIFVAGLIIKFFEGPFQKFRIMRRRRKYTYIFSGCNEKTLAIAKSIKKPFSKKIFACAEKEVNAKKKDEISDIKGIIVSETVADIVRRLKNKSKGMEVFLFDETEEENLTQLVEVCEVLEKRNRKMVKVYVELFETPWNLYNEISENRKGSDKLVINFVRSEENFAYNNMLKTSIFENAVYDGESRNIKVLIAGMNGRNQELLKTILYLGQMPGYRLTVMVLDEGQKKNIINRLMPEIYDECNVVGDAIYKLIYKENIKLSSNDLENILEHEYGDFTYAFVNSDDDIKNVSIATRINTYCQRKQRQNYKIQVNLMDKSMCDKWNKTYAEKLDVVGDFESVYDYNFITMSDIERGTMEIHNVRYPKSNPDSPTWVSYSNNEYKRHSVFARTLSFKHKIEIIDKFYNSDYSITQRDSIWKVYEHMRWNVYTRTMGYIKADNSLLENGELPDNIRDGAKVHNDLVVYDELPESEKKKDALILTPEIVKVLKSI
ncbi:MAG: hypothetical protein K6G26_08085 [Lachnospiraceae bacterium]|nr:hypothetical protein [Lachnospiraceae bacterium]